MRRPDTVERITTPQTNRQFPSERIRLDNISTCYGRSLSGNPGIRCTFCPRLASIQTRPRGVTQYRRKSPRGVAQYRRKSPHGVAQYRRTSNPLMGRPYPGGISQSPHGAPVSRRYQSILNSHVEFGRTRPWYIPLPLILSFGRTRPWHIPQPLNLFFSACTFRIH